MKKVGKYLLALVVVYLMIGALFYFFQDSILFHPKSVPANYKFSFDEPYEEQNLPFNNGNLNIVKFKPQNERKGLVLFFHGNTDNVEHYKKYPFFFLKNNYEVWMMDYPGFGKSTGQRTEKIMEGEALYLYDLALKQINADSIVIYGKSIGTGVASFLAANRSCRQLLLECPYYSIPCLAKHYLPVYPVNFLIRYSFPTHEYLKTVKAPITIFHGNHDEIIPYEQSKRLKKENSRIDLITIEKGGHNDLSNFASYRSALDSHLQH